MNRRNRRRVLVSLVALPIIGLALWFAWENRGSEKIITAVAAPVVLVAGYYVSSRFLPGSEKYVTAAILAVVGLIAVVVFTPPISLKRVAVATFLMRADTQAPVFIPLMAAPMPLIVAMHNAPEKIWSTDDDGGVRVYHHLLQRAILEALVEPQFSWGTEVERYTTLIGRGELFQMAKDAGTFISAEQIKSTFAANRFIAAPFTKYTIRGAGLIVPDHTTLSGEVPDENQGHTTGRIRLRNRFYELTIETQFTSSMRGLHGRYALLTSGRDQDTRFGLASYIVRVTARGSRLFSLNPELPKYAEWLQAIADRLATTFDEEEKWKLAMEHLTVGHVLSGGAR